MQNPKKRTKTVIAGETLINSTTNSDNEVTLEITPSEDTEAVIVNTDSDDDTLEKSRFSRLSGNSIRFVDFYRDARTFLEKANSTKFIIVSYILLTSPVLLMFGFLSEGVYRELVALVTLTYLGVDVYEKQTLVRRKG